MTLLLRLSAARFLVPAGSAAALLMVLLDRGWQGGWGDTVLRVTTQLLLVLPVVMAAGALDARRLLRGSHQPSAAAAVRPGRTVAALAVAVTIWGVLGYTAVLVTASAVTLRINPVVPPASLLFWVAAGAAAVAAHASLGVLLGRLVPAVVALALSALLGLVGNAALAAYQGRPAALFTVADDAYLGGPFVPHGIVQLLQVVFFAAVSWAAIAATAALVRRSRSGGVTAVAGLVAVLVAGVVLAGTGGDKRVELVAADGPRRCSGDGVVCLWEDRAFLLDAYARTGRRMLVGAPAALTVRGWSEAGLARSADRAELTILSNEPDAEQIAAGLANGITARLALDPDYAAARQAELWLAARALDEPARSQYVATFAPALGAVLATAEPEQWRWFLDVVERQP